MRRYAGVILAGGRGARMGELGVDHPKTLLPLGNEPLIAHHLRLLRGLGIEDVYVIVGHLATEIVRVLGTGERFGLHLHYVEQGAPLGSAHALGRLRGIVREPFVLLLGDYYCAISEPERFVRRLASGQSAIAAKREPERRLIAEACEVHVAPDGRVTSIVEKPAVPVGDLKGCGVYALQPEIFDAIGRTPRTALRDEYELTLALQLHIEAGHPLYAEDVVRWDRNLTRPEDVLESNIEWLRIVGRNELIAEEARIGENVELARTVVGGGAHVPSGARLRDVVVFPGAHLASNGPIERALVTPAGTYPLRSDHGQVAIATQPSVAVGK